MNSLQAGIELLVAATLDTGGGPTAEEVTAAAALLEEIQTVERRVETTVEVVKNVLVDVWLPMTWVDVSGHTVVKKVVCSVTVDFWCVVELTAAAEEVMAWVPH